METQETPAQNEQKPGQKISAKKLWNSLKHSAEKWHQTVWTGGIIAIMLGIILIAVIVSYENKSHKFEQSIWYQPHYQVHSVMPRMFDTWWMTDIEKSWARMHEELRDMERRHEKMMRAIEETPKVINDGQYTGYKNLNGNTLQYTLNIADDSLTGTLLGTDTEELNRLRTELEKTGVTITNTNGNIQFTVPKDKLESIVQIMNK
jgi:hypothetical protein